MAYCILPNDKGYQILSERSGIPSTSEEFKNFVGYFREQYGRDPFLDEIPHSDSRLYLKELLKITGNSTKYVDKLLLESFLSETDLTKALLKLNTIFRDKEIELIPTNEDIIINIVDRPSKYKLNESVNLDIINPDSTTFFVDGLYKMVQQYGINFKLITDKLIEQQFLNLHVLDSKAFIYNGDIYINIDKADVNSPIHEMLHLLVGSMRFTNKESYNKLLSYVQLLPEFESYSQTYVGRTTNDISEEALVDLIAKLLTSKTSKIPKEMYHDIFYEILRNLDTLLMGNYSTTSIPFDYLLDLSLLDIGKIVQSLRLVNNFNGLLLDSYIHRLLNNVKADLLKSNKLKLNCI